MHGRVALLVLGLALAAALLPAPADAQGLLGRIRTSTSSMLNRMQAQTTDLVDNLVKKAVTRNKDEICFPLVGCFSLKSPWVSLKRPLPMPKSPDSIAVKFYLYTRSAPQRFSINDYTDMNLDGSDFNPERQTFFITHGFLNHGDMDWQAELKDGILKHVDGNVFIVDWGGGAIDPNYLQAASNTRVVGETIALLGKTLVERFDADPKTFHLLGHSLGAHISGYAARSISNVGRVTAFDPAGPGFENLPRLVRLSKYVADFVDVLHTDAKPLTNRGFGMMGTVGHVDFYVNGGKDQPGCTTPNVKVPKNIIDMVSIPVNAMQHLIECSHVRSFQYFTEALKNPECRFWGHKTSIAKQKLSWKINRPSAVPDARGDCTEGRCIPIGLDTPQFPARGAFYVKTAASAPYCLKEDSDAGQTLEELKSLGLVN